MNDNVDVVMAFDVVQAYESGNVGVVAKIKGRVDQIGRCVQLFDITPSVLWGQNSHYVV